jgi:hypothetical protein
MRRLLIFLFTIASTAVYSQQIEIGNTFVIQFKNLNQGLEFEIISRKEFNGVIDMSRMDSLFVKPKEDQIIGVFAKGKFGNDVNTMLVLLNGLDKTVDFQLKIKLPNKKKLMATSVSPLHKGVKSIEYWPYPIQLIEFRQFTILPKENLKEFVFEVKVDSTCIKKSDKNITFGESEFRTQVKSIVYKFEQSEAFALDQALNEEKHNNSKDVSLGHYWSLSDGIYPNEKHFKFGNPISYRRFECPYFEGKKTYFYTKDKNEVKVISYEWETFKESNMGISPEIKNDVSEKFNEKYSFLVKTITELIGAPLDIEQEKDSGRSDTKWKTSSGISAYLFKFKSYNEIRLYIYKE